MKFRIALPVLAAFAISAASLTAQTNTAATNVAVEAVAPLPPYVTQVTNPVVSTNFVLVTNMVVSYHTNAAIIPVPRPAGQTNAVRRTEVVLQRAKGNPGPCDIAFIGDSITQLWETTGSNVWAKYYGERKCLNFGVGGDRTEHLLWRFEQGQLNGVKPKVAVLMIGTNNSNKNKDGTEQYTESDILEGVQAIINGIRLRLPETKIILCAILPRGATFSTQRGKILQVNQALAKLDDGKMVFYIDFGSQMIEADGSISLDMMPDKNNSRLHPAEKGYEIWAAAIEPKLKELLAN